MIPRNAIFTCLEQMEASRLIDAFIKAGYDSGYMHNTVFRSVYVLCKPEDIPELQTLAIQTVPTVKVNS